MLAHIFLLIFLFAFYAFLQNAFVDWPAKWRIFKLHSTAEAIALRRVVRRRRRILFCVYVSLIFTFLAATSALSDYANGYVEPADWGWLLTFPGMMWLYLRGEKNYERLMGCISIFDKQRFLAEHEDFALFLRGFASDDYTSEKTLLRRLKKLRRTGHFSEFAFSKVLGQRTTVCAIGMTREISSPVGAVRVYVDDSSWQQDVHDLMERAKAIYVLVNDSPSCIWEIAECKEWLGKTVFIVDDPQKYENVRRSDRLRGVVFPELPNVKQGKAKTICAVAFKDETAVVSTFENSIRGLADYLGIPLPSEERRHGCGCLLIAFVGLILLFPIIWVNVGRQFNEDVRCRMILDEYRKTGGNSDALVISQGTSILSPIGAIPVQRDSPKWKQVHGILIPGFITQALFVRDAKLSVSGALSSEIIEVAEWTNATFSTSFAFKKQMEAEKRLLSSSASSNAVTNHDEIINGVHFPEHFLETNVATISEPTRDQFGWTVIQEERLNAGTQDQWFFTALACRYVRIGEKSLFVKWWQVFSTKESAVDRIENIETELKQWADVIQAANHRTRKDGGEDHEHR